jgi:thiamine-phosphate pyrophosphorylase
MNQRSLPEHRATYRILDANANRAAEGLRTLEEIARFAMNHRPLAQRFKQLRHDVQSQVDRLDQSQLLASRDAQGDCGLENSTPQELHRPRLDDVAKAASGRVQQSMRCLEEFCKIAQPDLAGPLESLRYQCYDAIAQLLAWQSEPGQFLAASRLYVLVDCQRSEDDFARLLRDISRAGVDLVQLRDKSASDRTILSYARCALENLDRARTRLIINDRVDLAIASGADGVHLGQNELPLAKARALLGPGAWIGISTHTLDQARQAWEGGADYLGCGPTFPSNTKDFSDFPGLPFLRQVAQAIEVPAFAIGGIQRDNLSSVLGTGIQRIAVGAAVLQAADPREAASELRNQLTSNNP